MHWEKNMKMKDHSAFNEKQRDWQKPVLAKKDKVQISKLNILTTKFSAASYAPDKYTV